MIGRTLMILPVYHCDLHKPSLLSALLHSHERRFS
jgi:hypothetical protein